MLQRSVNIATTAATEITVAGTFPRTPLRDQHAIPANRVYVSG
jgi:hypothetical protein